MTAVAPCRENRDLDVTNKIIVSLFWKRACNIGLEKEACLFCIHTENQQKVVFQEERFEVRGTRTLGIG